jgi:hypothetical protein
MLVIMPDPFRCRATQAIESIPANQDELGIPTDGLSHKGDLAPFA